MGGEHHGDGRASDSGRHHVSHRPSTSTAWTRAAFAAIVLLLSFVAPVAAGPLEDAYDASSRGDYATALRLSRPLANQGNAHAQINLGVMHDKGLGVPQDDVRAHMWFNLSAAQGNQNAAGARDIIAKRMTPAQIAEAQKLAREWQPKRP